MMQRLGNVETIEQHGGVAFGGVAVFLADNSFELREPHALRVGHVRDGVEVLALLERFPQALIAHDYRVNDAELVERELVLPQDAELLRARDGPRLRL